MTAGARLSFRGKNRLAECQPANRSFQLTSRIAKRIEKKLQTHLNLFLLTTNIHYSIFTLISIFKYTVQRHQIHL